MKKGPGTIMFFLILVVIVLSTMSQSSTDAVSAASEELSWRIDLSGVRKDILVDSYYSKLLNAGAAERTAEKKGTKYAYRGVPLSKIIAIIDGTDSEAPFTFDEALWKAGYSITLVGKDGYTATFSTKDLSPDALILAVQENGAWIAPSTVGDSPKNLWVKDLAAIETSLAPNPAFAKKDAFSLEFDINGAKSAYGLEELAESPLYMEGKGSYTTSAGTKYTNTYGGVRLRDLIERSAMLSPEDTVSFVAMDGYEMSYPGSLVMDESDGVWILAFKADGEALPKDPGYIRTIKVGPGNPNISGHLSVKMVKRIIIKQKDYKDFSLRLEGKKTVDLDRSTIQSGVSCHKKTVNFEQKGKASAYTGIPLWLILAYIDDPLYAPHKQDKSIISYDEAAAKSGYKIKIIAADGFSVTLDSREVNRNDAVILAMYKNGENLPEGEFPLMLAWDKSAKVIPAGIKSVRMITSIQAIF